MYSQTIQTHFNKTTIRRQQMAGRAAVPAPGHPTQHALALQAAREGWLRWEQWDAQELILGLELGWVCQVPPDPSDPMAPNLQEHSGIKTPGMGIHNQPQSANPNPTAPVPPTWGPVVKW